MTLKFPLEVLKAPKSLKGIKMYQFDSFSLDPDERVTSHNGIPLPLTPKAFQALLCFLRNPGRLIFAERCLHCLSLLLQCFVGALSSSSTRSAESAPPLCDLKECLFDCLWILFGISLKGV